ncbi:MAG: hypothetical protein IKM19_09905 [Firmicutes bacterium]|nr:hypothetical protein [Bacillota bacterium]
MGKFLIIMCIMVISAGAAWANSAQTSWEGQNRAGIIITDETCPLIVESELLTFDVQEFPENYYRSKEEYLSYQGKVTAEYTFHNPADYQVTATLAFPFGNEPDYAYDHNPDTEVRERNTDTGKYDITVNGEKISSQLRHTFSYRYGQFDLEKDLPRLSDGYVKDSFYSPDMPVTKYIYEVTGVDKETYNSACTAFVWTAASYKSRIFLENNNGYQIMPEGARLSSWTDEGEEKVIYIIGDIPSSPVEWKIYENGACEKEIPGEVILKDTVNMTMKDFTLTCWNEETGVSESDWYNAVISQFNLRDDGKGILSLDTYLDVSDDLMRWYKYDITFGPGETIVNTVTAPIYPAIDGGGKVPVYGYEYLLSPASTWADFGKLDIVINTPHYMLDSSLKGFEKTESGYALSMDGLPEGELEFTLCSEEKPGIAGRTGGYIIAVPLIAAAPGLLLLFKRRRKTE